MRFCSFYKDGELRLGAAVEGGVADLSAAGFRGDINAVIKSRVLASDAVRLSARAPVLPESELRFANVCDAGKIVCVGLNYRRHAAETGDKLPEKPVIFSKYRDALCASGDSVELPGWFRQYDYEAELVIVMGKTAWGVSAGESMDYVFGYTAGNDMSIRDAQFLSPQWLTGKTMPNFAPAGPYIVTADSFDPAKPNAIRCYRNGVRVQDGTTDDMAFNCAELISFISHAIRLEPGDLIFTGTPSGVILGKKGAEQVWLTPGETVTVEIEGIGSLVNRMA